MKNLFSVVVILLGQHCTDKNPRGSRQHCTGKKLSALSSKQHHFLTIFILDRLLKIPRQHCTNFTDIAQEKSGANIEQKDKIARNKSIKSPRLDNIRAEMIKCSN